LRAELSAIDRERATRFVRAHVGKPHREGADGPGSFDCWGLTRCAQREIFGRDLPLLDPACRADPAAMVAAVAEAAIRSDWPPIKGPVHGAIITMVRGREHHIGVFLTIDFGGLLHSTVQAGVAFDQLVLLPAQGWSRVRYYDYQPPASPAAAARAVA
jgi:hypothetical protein